MFAFPGIVYNLIVPPIVEPKEPCETAPFLKFMYELVVI